MSEIKIINKEVTNSQKTYYVELDLNKKVYEISITESYNEAYNEYSVLWDFVEVYEDITDEENDLIDDWVTSYKYAKKEVKE